MYIPRYVVVQNSTTAIDFEATNLAPGVGALHISGSTTAANNGTFHFLIEADGTILLSAAIPGIATVAYVAGSVPTTYPGVGTNAILRVTPSADAGAASRTIAFYSVQPRAK